MTRSVYHFLVIATSLILFVEKLDHFYMAIPNPIFRSAFVIAIALVAVFTLLVFIFQNEKMWDWLIQLVSMVVSVLAALLIGVAIFNYEQSQEEELQKQHIIAAVGEHLDQLSKTLDLEGGVQIFTEKYDGKRVPIFVLSTVAIEKVAYGGIFSEECAREFIILETNVRGYNSWVNAFLYYLGIGSPNIETAALNIDRLRGNIKGHAENLRNELQVCLL